jgi:hypothetical protein
MKRAIVAVVAFFALAAVAVADDGIYFKAGQLDLIVPCKTVNVISLYDLWHGQGLMGVETPVAAFYGVNLNIGAVTSELYKGTPIVSANYDWGKLVPNIPIAYLSVGIWYGYDFDKVQNMAGVKASATLHIF